jgi:hypothetical protein
MERMNNMNNLGSIFVGCVGITFALAIIVLAIGLTRAAAPRNERERIIDDLQQMKALGYFDNTITSGSAVTYKDE